jgi:hypothetical protein
MRGWIPILGATSAAILAVAALGVGAALAGDGEDCPPNPVPGQCYEKVLVPPRYETRAEQVLDIPARTGVRTVPAVYGEEVRQELVRAERVETWTVPATYRTVYDTVVVQPASYRLETVPAEYQTVTERVLVREAHTEWRRGVLIENRPTAPGATQVLPTGEVLCLIEVPAEYRLVSRQVMTAPARTVRVEVPAVTRTVARQVVDCPAHAERRVMPAEYRWVRARVLIQPERQETWSTPAVYRTVTSRRLVSEGRFEWRVIRCEDGRPVTPRPYGGAQAAPYGPAPQDYNSYP